MRARDVSEARAFLVAHLRRTWGVAAFMAAARLICWRIPEVGLSLRESEARAGRRPRRRPGAAPPDAQLAAQAYADAFLLRLGPHAPPARP